MKPFSAMLKAKAISEEREGGRLIRGGTIGAELPDDAERAVGVGWDDL